MAADKRPKNNDREFIWGDPEGEVHIKLIYLAKFPSYHFVITQGTNKSPLTKDPYLSATIEHCQEFLNTLHSIEIQIRKVTHEFLTDEWEMSGKGLIARNLQRVFLPFYALFTQGCLRTASGMIEYFNKGIEIFKKMKTVLEEIGHTDPHNEQKQKSINRSIELAEKIIIS